MPGWDVPEDGGYIRNRRRDPSDFAKGKLRTLKLPNGVRVIRGQLREGGKWATQAVLYPKTGFTLEEAKAWAAEHEDLSAGEHDRFRVVLSEADLELGGESEGGGDGGDGGHQSGGSSASGSFPGLVSADRDAALRELAAAIAGGTLTTEQIFEIVSELPQTVADELYGLLDVPDASVYTARRFISAKRPGGGPVRAFSDGDEEDDVVSFASLRGVELLSVGTHNTRSHGKVTITTEKLDRITRETAARLADEKPPIKLGHDNKLGDSEPRLGTLVRVYRRGGKLLGDFRNVARTVYVAVKKRLYTRVSVELNPDPEYVRAVAFLGATSPAVKNLRDILALSDGGGDVAGDEAITVEITFSAEDSAGTPAGGDTEGDQMDGKQTITPAPGASPAAEAVTPKQFADLEARVATLTTENAALRGELKRARIEREADSLVASRRLRPADRALFTDHALTRDDRDVVTFSDGGKETKGSSLDALFADYRARAELWPEGEIAFGEKPTEGKADPAKAAALADGVAFAERHGIDPEIVRKHTK
jgi:hypothetical protein